MILWIIKGYNILIRH